MTDENNSHIKYFTGFEQGSVDWRKAREGLVTCSKLSEFLKDNGDPRIKKNGWAQGAQTYMFSLLADRMKVTDDYVDADETVIYPPDGESQFWIQRGHALEIDARTTYKLESAKGAQVLHNVSFIYNEKYELGGSPDATIAASVDSIVSGIAEIKALKSTKHLKIMHEGMIPATILPQCNGLLLAAECDWLEFVSYHDKARPAIIRINALSDEFQGWKEKAVDGIKLFNSALTKLQNSAAFVTQDDELADA